MARIWISRKDKIFHLSGEVASWDGDYNTPATAILVESVTRKSGVLLEIKTDNDILTLDVTPKGRTGGCIQCGQCCSHRREDCPHKAHCDYKQIGKYHVCEYLIEYPRNGGIGKPGGAACAIRDRILIEGRRDCLYNPSDNKWLEPACGMRFEE